MINQGAWRHHTHIHTHPHTLSLPLFLRCVHEGLGHVQLVEGRTACLKQSSPFSPLLTPSCLLGSSSPTATGLGYAIRLHGVNLGHSLLQDASIRFVAIQSACVSGVQKGNQQKQRHHSFWGLPWLPYFQTNTCFPFVTPGRVLFPFSLPLTPKKGRQLQKRPSHPSAEPRDGRPRPASSFRRRPGPSRGHL